MINFRLKQRVHGYRIGRTMSKQLFDHEWMALELDDEHERLDLIWKPATAEMGAEGFQLALSMYAAEAVVRCAKNLLVDTRGFRFGGFGEVEPWRQKSIIPLYNHAGVTRFAYVFPEGVDLPPAKEAGDGEEFATRYFGSYDDAVSWLAS